MSRKNGNILSFFKPVSSQPASQASQASNSQRSAPPAPSSPAVPPLPSSPYLPSSPVPEPVTRPRPLHISRDAVIKGSDDEGDDDSDDSLPDLFAVARKVSPAPPARKDGGNPCVTPRAKRTALEFHSSPLAIMPKHKFDMQSLLSHAKRDNATEASAQRLTDLANGDAANADGEVDNEDVAAAALREHVTDDDDSGGDDVAHYKFKLARALERSETGRARKRWHFFQQGVVEESVLARTPHPFPKEAAKGTWSFLRDARERQANFLSRLPYTVQYRKGDLPDEIYTWILDEICFEKSDMLRREYVDLLSVCPDQTQRLLSPHEVVKLFSNLGPSKEFGDFSTPLTCTTEPSSSRPTHLLPNLKAVLTLLAKISSGLEVESMTTAVKALLRLGIDQVVIENIELLSEYQAALRALADAVPPGAWDNFCEEVTICLYHSVWEASLRWQPLSCMGVSTPRSHELRRRMAAAFFFDEPPRASEPPQDSVSVRAVADRLEAGDFTIGVDTEYLELNALMRLLDVAVDDGSRGSFNSPHARIQFDADIDKLRQKLKVLLSKIDANRGMHVSRIDAKTTIEWVLDRLTHAVRSKPPPKVSILDIPQEKEDPFLPKQQAYMKKFFLPKKEES